MWHPPRSALPRPVTGVSGPRAGTPVVTAHGPAPVCRAEHSVTASSKGAGSAMFPLDGTLRIPGAGAAHSHRTPSGPAVLLPCASGGGRRGPVRSGPRTSRTADPTSS